VGIGILFCFIDANAWGFNSIFLVSFLLMGGDKNFVLFIDANAWGFNFHFFGALFVDVLRFEI
jgi:hypothetical protein